MDALELVLPGVALNLQHLAPRTVCPRHQDDQTAQIIAITPRRLCRIQVLCTRRGQCSQAAPTSSAPALPASSAHLVHTSNSALQFPVFVRLLGAVDCPFGLFCAVSRSRVSHRLLPAYCIIVFAGTPTFGAAHTPDWASVSQSPNTTRYDAPCRALVFGPTRELFAKSCS